MSRLVAPFTDAQRAGFIAAARSYRDTPFRHRGRTRRHLDCLGLVFRSFADIGITLPDRAAYGRDPSNDGLRAAVIERLGEPMNPREQPITPAELQPGDIVTMKWHDEENHVAIITDYPMGGLAVIHAYAQAGRVVEHALADPWPRRLCDGWRP